MVRKNEKFVVVNLDNSIKKSNDISLAKLNQGLTLNQMQLLSYAIFCTQKNGATTFNKADFEKKFNIDEYRTNHAKIDSEKLLGLKISILDMDNDYFEFWNVFTRMKYVKGTFTFKWNDEFIPHILDLKERYIVNDLTITANFKSSFSWNLYEHLKALFGYWYKSFTKEELMELFNVPHVKSYKSNTALFKQKVLDVAINEINQYTELKAWYVEKKKGRAIIGFEIHWSVASKQEVAATEKQLKEITTIIDAVEADIWNYLEVLGEMDMEKLHLMNTIQKVLQCRKEVNSTLTNTKANEILQRLKVHLHSLQSQLDNARRKKELTSKPNYVPFYNWLDERE